MKRVIFIFTVLFSFNLAMAQSAFSELAARYAAEGNYEKALEYELKGLEIITYISSKQSEDYATSLNNLAGYYSELGKYSEAIRLGEEALEIREKIHGKEYPNYASSLNNLANYYAHLGNYSEAIKLGTEALEIRGKIYGEDHPNYATSLNNLAGYYSELGNFTEAIRLGSKAVKIDEITHGKSHPNYANSLHNLALYYFDLGNYAEAINLGTEALKIQEEILGMNHPDYAVSLSNLALYYFGLGNYAEAINLGTEALKIQEEILGKNHSAYALSLNNMASYYFNLGNYSEAIQLGLEALKILEEILGKDHPDYASSLNCLAGFYSALGNYSEAIKLGTEALEIREKVFGKYHPDYVSSLNNLALFFSYLENYAEAIRIGSEVLKIQEEVLGKNHPDNAVYLSNLALYYNDLSNYAEAIHLGTEALKIQEEILGKNHPAYAVSLNNLAFYNSYLGNYAEALKLGTKALEIIENIFGKDNPDYAISLNAIAEFYCILGDVSNLKTFAKQTYDIKKKHLLSNFNFLSLKERVNYWNLNYINSFFGYSTLTWAYDDPEKDLIELAYNSSLLSKGILLNSAMEFDKFLAEAGDEALLEKYKEIKSLRLQLNKLYEKPIAERWCDTDSLERQANELERQLMRESAEFGDYTRNLAITWEDVRDNLKEKDAAIEFVHFPLNNDSTIYMAYVLQTNMETPQLVKLFEEKDLRNLIDEDDKTSIYTNKSASELIWGKLKPQLEGVENVYFAPDGVLHQIALEYFPDMDGDGMISDRFNLHRLSSTREIVVNRHNAPAKEAVIYGGIKYDTDVSIMETESRKYDRPKHRGFSPYYNLGDSLALRGSLDYLDGSLTEAENINGMMKENYYNSLFLSGNDATEESFKNLSGKANGIIHISTHGFYWTESEAERKASHNDRLMFMSQMGDNARRNVEDKALTRTGLFMAGAKNALSGVELPEDVDDGILTAQEIANLDLRDLDLVVLSACQTGMGDISGDGVFGLQRGFKKAGANTILMSLWDVSDEATQILMTNFYKKYLGGMSKQQALREAQKAVRETPGFSDPEYWAAFILLDALN